MQPIYIVIAIPFFLLSIAFEYWYSQRKGLKLYRLNDTINNLLVGMGQQISNLFGKAILFGLFMLIYDNYRFFSLPFTWWSVALCVLAYDFAFYWAHRLGHEVNFFWGAHAVHHQSEEYNLSVALRQSWFHSMIAFIFFLPIPLLGFSPLTFGAGAAIQTLYQFWIHTRTMGKLHPAFEYIFNTPAHHRVHHAINPKYIDKNHGGVLIIWDRMFGTFKEEENAEEITYGITTQLKSWNPVWANFHYYFELWDKAKTFTHFSDKVKLIFARPGWLPEEAGGFQAVKEVDKATYQKFDADIKTNLRWYAAIQFTIVLAGTTAFLYHFPNITPFFRVYFASLIGLSMLILGGIFENKKWTWVAEIIRIIAIAVGLDTYYWYWHIKWFDVTLAITLVSSITCLVWLAVHYHLNKEKYA